MISIWWVIPSVLVGILIGIFFIALCTYNNSSDPKKWWEE